MGPARAGRPIRAFINAGMNGYLAQPIIPATLSATLDKRPPPDGAQGAVKNENG